MSDKCDKCGREVQPWGDATLLYERALNKRIPGTPRRHLFPVGDGMGNEICEGSPSTAQYIAGQPRDTRPEYAYVPEIEPKIREAFAQICAEHGQPLPK